MKKTLSLLLAIMMVVGLLAGCTTNVPSESPANSEEPAPTETVPTEPVPTDAAPEATPVAEEPSAFPMTVTDQIGNEVTVEHVAERIVSGYYISSSTCIALGLKDKLVATEEKTDKRPIYKLAAPELINVEAAGICYCINELSCCKIAPKDMLRFYIKDIRFPRRP